MCIYIYLNGTRYGLVAIIRNLPLRKRLGTTNDACTIGAERLFTAYECPVLPPPVLYYLFEKLTVSSTARFINFDLSSGILRKKCAINIHNCMLISALYVPLRLLPHTPDDMHIVNFLLRSLNVLR